MNRRETKRTARRLLKISKLDGRVSEDRVAQILEALKKTPPSERKPLLKHYANYLKKELARHQIIVEYAGALPDASLKEIEQTLSSRYGRPLSAVRRENPALVGGLRIRVGDDLYDASIATLLSSLVQAAR